MREGIPIDTLHWHHRLLWATEFVTAADVQLVVLAVQMICGLGSLI